jgi:predicted GNAT family N-acyltransferase
MVVHARDVAVGFYERLGYQSVGEPFVEIGLPHQTMEKELAG